MEARQSLIVSDLRHFQDGLDGDILDNLLQGLGRGELCGDMEWGVAFVVDNVNRGPS